jgi:hypothetical protein
MFKRLVCPLPIGPDLEVQQLVSWICSCVHKKNEKSNDKPINILVGQQLVKV